jgi:AMP nucleosidase
MSAQDPFVAARAVVDEIVGLHAGAVTRLRQALQAFIASGERPDAEARARGAFCYPRLERRRG